MLTILQLSDIHFAHPEGATFDLDREIQDGLIRFLPAIVDQIGSVDLIVVSGDIAFSGVADQYERAKAYLRDVRSKLGNPDIPVRVIPGNHDVHWPTTDHVDQAGWRNEPRRSKLSADERAAKLAALLSGLESGPGLLKALDAYNDFAAAFGCAITPQNPFWEDTFQMQNGWKLRVRGLTSVLVSDQHDQRDRVVLGLMQLGGLEPRPGEINLTLCHHPYCWLLDGEELRPKLEHRSQIHITGHVHQHEFRELPAHVHLMAGAVQPPRSEKVEPRFNVVTLGILSQQEPRLEVAMFPLVWVAKKDSFVIDRDNCKACSLALTGPPPAGAVAQLAEQTVLARLTERLDALPLSDQLHVAKSICMSPGAVMSKPPHQQVAAIVEHASRRGKMAELRDQVVLRHGNQAETADRSEVTE